MLLDGLAETVLNLVADKKMIRKIRKNRTLKIHVGDKMYE